ncbi:MAG: HAD family hydrolase [Candidatus Saccharimonadales bacterium]
MIKAVILDCFGVLYIPVGEDFYQSHVPNYEKKRDELRDLGRQADYGLISQEDLVLAVAQLTEMDPNDVRDKLVGGLVRNQALLDFSQSLRPQYKIGMLSNISASTMDTFFTQKEREQYFDDVVISSEVGMTKPHPAIFELACRRLGVDTSEAVMIDDSSANCAGALEAGMQAIVYESFAQTTSALKKFLTNSK